ncbi:unnamed protein product [Paramecium sonneborni]|uniref:Uncharacterized protein n=1 Tax=Paramecium sonneborni TaxID=65129 RepID=A0A8S1P813_9CILI|nr:unnamed protein product [Paramecium sonneborni]
MVFRVTFKVLSVIKKIRTKLFVIRIGYRREKVGYYEKLEMILVNKFGKMVLFILESEKKLSQWL